jgi:hypothetical protein
MISFGHFTAFHFDKISAFQLCSVFSMHVIILRMKVVLLYFIKVLLKSIEMLNPVGRYKLKI